MQITGALWAIMLAGLFAIVGVWAFMRVGSAAGKFKGALS
jgi:hypothetical protein